LLVAAPDGQDVWLAVLLFSLWDTTGLAHLHLPLLLSRDVPFREIAKFVVLNTDLLLGREWIYKSCPVILNTFMMV
jgi:hypothetical protein